MSYQERLSRHETAEDIAHKALRKSPLAMNIYTWLSNRMSDIDQKTKPIPWETLMMQFGSRLSRCRDFRKVFLGALNAVKEVYPAAEVEVSDAGVSLLPSPTHVESQKIYGERNE